MSLTDGQTLVQTTGRRITSVEKALHVLEAASAKGESSLAELARATALHKPTLLRLIGILIEAGFLERTRHGRYSVTLKLWRIGCSVVHYDMVRERIIPLLHELVELTGETTHYAVYEASYSVYVEKVEGTHPIRAYTTIGGRSPAYASATGKALLAWRSVDEINAVAAGARRHTRTTIATPRAIAAELEWVRSHGYAINRGEWRKDVWGVAAPVVGRSGLVVAAVGVSGPEDRISPSVDRLARRVQDCARRIGLLHGAAEDAA